MIEKQKIWFWGILLTRRMQNFRKLVKLNWKHQEIEGNCGQDVERLTKKPLLFMIKIWDQNHKFDKIVTF